MATISKEIADDIIAGKYPEDNVVKIVTYENMFDGDLTYAMVTGRDSYYKYEESPACRAVKIYWQRDPNTPSYTDWLFAELEGKNNAR